MVILTSSGFDNPGLLPWLAEHSPGPWALALVVTTGSVPLKERNPNALKTRQALEAFGIPRVEFVDVEVQDPRGLLEADLVVILGGNSRHLFDQVRASGTAAILGTLAARGTPVVGVSAGSMLLAGGNGHCRWVDPLLDIDQGFPDGFDHRGLGFSSHLVLPHMARFREIKPDLEEALSLIEAREGVTITRMENGEWIGVDTPREVQQRARAVLDQVGATLSSSSTERSVARTCVELLGQAGVVETWYHGCPALVLLGSRSRLSVSGRDYQASDEEVGENNLVTVDLSPALGPAWGDCARSFVIEEGSWAPEPRTPAFRRGREALAHLHRVFTEVVTPGLTLDQVFRRMNDEIVGLGYQNLDFLGNVGHSIVRRLEDRQFIEAGNPLRIGDLDLFTFEPHIGEPGGSWGFKHEEIYRFRPDGRVVLL